jgi:TonB family protein
MWTIFTVTLDNTGQLKQAVVNRSSGLAFVDESAIDAFRKAQPFARPPPDLLDANGAFRFYFKFYLKNSKYKKVVRETTLSD